jgi:hypothetical protein
VSLDFSKFFIAPFPPPNILSQVVQDCHATGALTNTSYVIYRRQNLYQSATSESTGEISTKNVAGPDGDGCPDLQFISHKDPDTCHVHFIKQPCVYYFFPKF